MCSGIPVGSSLPFCFQTRWLFHIEILSLSSSFWRMGMYTYDKQNHRIFLLAIFVVEIKCKLSFPTVSFKENFKPVVS